MSDSGDDLRHSCSRSAATRCARRSRICKRSSAGSAPAARRPASSRSSRSTTYGAEVPLQQIAGISIPEPRVLVISPYDKGSMKAIEKAIQASDLGINPSNDGHVGTTGVPAADRGAAPGSREGREEPGRGGPGRGAQHPPADAPRPRSAREGRRPLEERPRPSREGAREGHALDGRRRSTRCSSTRSSELLEV